MTTTTRIASPAGSLSPPPSQPALRARLVGPGRVRGSVGLSVPPLVSSPLLTDIGCLFARAPSHACRSGRARTPLALLGLHDVTGIPATICGVRAGPLPLTITSELHADGWLQRWDSRYDGRRGACCTGGNTLRMVNTSVLPSCVCVHHIRLYFALSALRLAGSTRTVSSPFPPRAGKDRRGGGGGRGQRGSGLERGAVWWGVDEGPPLRPPDPSVSDGARTSTRTSTRTRAHTSPQFFSPLHPCLPSPPSVPRACLLSPSCHIDFTPSSSLLDVPPQSGLALARKRGGGGEMYHARPLPPHPTSTSWLGLHYNFFLARARPASPHVLLPPASSSSSPPMHPLIVVVPPSRRVRAHPASTRSPPLRLSSA
ncbi:hypothetical protein B0H14DRAFT_3464378 [Mycena olivaceomarginata]|nr:hypothetical protein B0H14DRAFT_3464378 [Mycena olivaceomarginata]